MTHTHSGSHSHRGQAGLSMIELMVALAISLVLLGGVIQMFVSSKKALRGQDALAVMQENARFALGIISRSVKSAGHWGGNFADTEVQALAGAAGSDCTVASGGSALTPDGTWGFRAVFGVEGVAPGPALPAACMPAWAYRPNTDVLVTRFGDEMPIPDAGLAAAGSEVFVRAQVGFRSILTRGATAIANLPLATGQAPVPLNYPYRYHAYFIRPCALTGADLVCGTSDDEAGLVPSIPSLARLTLGQVGGAPTVAQEVLVEGVENLQLLFGVDTTGDGFVNVYQNANNVVAANWDDVYSVQVSVLVRSGVADPEINDTRTYPMAGSPPVTVPAGGERFQRKVFTTLVQLRNRSTGL